ncbi:rhamnopyranosyl-N-acetylglucosaminyl-diphospho-decaprenol beta-1,3/1,4-galactofuranosyltransferase [Modestobacter sp. DSM 44400]|uniref:galactofuranosyltransferase GlfT1 n=1 Tax=Modestobacter sp. DSM 44400 TaxID=1550230 RepID=UPI0008974652|nr:glycosyltransferase family 2 protein [Modestobacter sp. DSM 44400]SDX49305.1 rhamnopyranosyl-N-acetylglucosaminyl-diphospho-decaprenol beta-1,3/1,4-galactofuranosyltransferase [Modestobacter sp. DSM 44400]
MSTPDGDRVVAVIVTRHRQRLLALSLAAIAGQTRPVDHVVVVDNGPDQPARDVVDASGLPVTYLPSERNLGGAGGFALGMLHALALGADWVWCADDDGRPADDTVLATLLATARRHGLAEVSPLVTDMSDPDRLAFPLRRGLRWRRARSDFSGLEVLPSYASLFNGALFTAAALDVVGVPDYRLFFRGDETEVHRRLVRSGLSFGTAVQAAYLHPQGTSEFEPILGGRLSAQYPTDEVKRFFTYRNRGYLMAQPGMRWLLPLEWVRFSYFFLVHRRDPGAWRSWLRLTRAGRRERFTRP